MLCAPKLLKDICLSIPVYESRISGRTLRPLLRRIIPSWIQYLLRPVYHCVYRANLKCRCWYSDHTSSPIASVDLEAWGRQVPPAMLRFRVDESGDPSLFLRVGRETAGGLAASLRRFGFGLERPLSVLDFGCGCGRTLGWLLTRFPAVRWYGTDIDAKAIEWCRRNLQGADFQLNRQLPPTNFDRGCFDVVYAISVFTHIDANQQSAWLREFHRILRPGGGVLFTVHSKSTWTSLTAAKRKRLEENGFLFEVSRKLRGIVPDWYQTAFHTQDYVRQMLAAQGFRILSYELGGLGFHDVVLATRLPDGEHDRPAVRDPRKNPVTAPANPSTRLPATTSPPPLAQPLPPVCYTSSGKQMLHPTYNSAAASHLLQSALTHNPRENRPFRQGKNRPSVTFCVTPLNPQVSHPLTSEL